MPLTDRKRVMVFADDDNAIDTKTHFEYIAHKIDLSAEGLIKAVEEAITIKLNGSENIEEKKPITTKKEEKKPTPAPIEEDNDLSSIAPDEDETTGNEMYGIDDDIFAEESEVKEEPALIKLDAARLGAIRATFRTADANTQKEVRKYLVNYNNKLSDEMLESDVLAIEKALGI